MAAIWLAGCPDGVPKTRLEGPSRSVVTLPPTSLLRNSLCDAGGPGFDSKVLKALQCAGDKPWDAYDAMGQQPPPDFRSRLPVLALVLVSAEDCVFHRGSQRAGWHEQSNVQLDCWHRPSDSYELSITDARVVVQPQHIFDKLTRQRGAGGIARASTSQPLFVPSWPEDAAEVRLRRSPGLGPLPHDFDEATDSVRAADVLRAWDIRTLAERVPVLTVPFPLAYLVAARCWHKLVLLTRWHKSLNLYERRRRAHQYIGPLAGWPPDRTPDEAEVWSRCGQHDSPHMIDDPAFDFMPDNLAKLVPASKKHSAIGFAFRSLCFCAIVFCIQ